MTTEKPVIRPERLKKLLRGLIDIYSPSGKEEEILEFTRDYLMGHGLATVMQTVDEDRYNLLVLPRGSEDIEVCFIGHLDTVAAYDLDDYWSHERGDEITGLGSADMKSGCAAMIEAFTAFSESDMPFPPVALALVIDEEEDNRGAEALAKEYSFPRAVIGEPTGLAPCTGHYAYLETFLKTRGRRAHSAVPEMGQNAIEAMLRLLLGFTGNIAGWGNGTVYNIRDLAGYPGGFIVPDICESWLDVHLPPSASIDAVKQRLRRFMKQAATDIPGLDASLEFANTYAGYRIDDDDPLLALLKKTFEPLSLPWAPQDFRSHSDGNLLFAAGVLPVIVGPGRLEAAHTPDEAVDFQEVVRAAQLYLALTSSLGED